MQKEAEERRRGGGGGGGGRELGTGARELGSSRARVLGSTGSEGINLAPTRKREKYLRQGPVMVDENVGQVLAAFVGCWSVPGMTVGIFGFIGRNANVLVAGAIMSSFAWMAVCVLSGLVDRVKKSSSDCIFRLNLLCLALVMFAPLIACSITAATALTFVELSSHDPTPPSFVFLTVACIAPLGLCVLCLVMIFGYFLLHILFTGLLAGLQAFISPAAFRDGAHAHNEVVKEHDCDHVLPNAVMRPEDSQSGETSITVAIAADPGRDLSRVQ